MATERVERRLIAVLAADVAGYSRLMELDEERTLARLKAHRRELIDPKIDEHNGRIVSKAAVDRDRCAATWREAAKGLPKPLPRWVSDMAVPSQPASLSPGGTRAGSCCRRPSRASTRPKAGAQARPRTRLHRKGMFALAFTGNITPMPMI